MSLWDMYDWQNDPSNFAAREKARVDRASLSSKSPAAKQIGGDHYLSMPIQPLEFSMANQLDACQHSIIKYITRRKGDKAKRLEDIDKAMHVLEYYKQWIIENE